MKKTALISLVAALLGGAGLLRAADAPAMPEMPAPVQEHTLLQQFVGEWESSFEAIMDPTQPPMKGKGTETARMLGGFWVLSEGRGEMSGMPAPMNSVFTLGYDPQQKKYVGSWIDSMTSYLWKYVGTVDDTGKVFTLETEGPCPNKPGISKFKDVIEFKSKDHRVMSSSMQGDDGKWQKMVTAEYRRKS